MKWIEFSTGNKPTQRSRGIYAIIGSKPKTAILKPIEDITGKYRALYDRLSGLAHLRENSLRSIRYTITYMKQRIK